MPNGRILFGAETKISSIRYLRAFRSVATNGSVGQAAIDLHLSQPALSRAIARLERDVGVCLFKRSRTGSVLTEAGRAFLLRTERFLSQFTYAVERCQGDTPKAKALSTQISLLQAEVLAAIVLVDSLAGAGALLEMSANHVRRALRSLEQLLDMNLLRHGEAEPAPTLDAAELGRRFMLAGREITDGVAELAHLQGGSFGRITVGALPVGSSFLLAAPLQALAAEEPRPRVQIVDGSYQERLKNLRNGSLDLVIAHLEQNVPEDVMQEALLRDDYVVVARAGHPLFHQAAPVLLPDLEKLEWILPPDSGRRSAFTRLFSKAPKLPEVIFETYSRSMTRALLVESDRITLLNRCEMLFEERAGILRRLPYPPLGPAHTLALLFRKDWLPTPVQSRFLELLRAHARTHAIQLDSALRVVEPP